MHVQCRLWVQAVWKLIHRRNVENTIPQHGIQPYVRSIISSHIAQFLKNISTRAADVEVFTQPGPIADITRADSMCCRSTSIACMSKIVGALVRCKRFYEFSNQPPEFLHGALGAFAQQSFEFRERHLDGIEVWRICRQIAECY